MTYRIYLVIYFDKTNLMSNKPVPSVIMVLLAHCQTFRHSHSGSEYCVDFSDVDDKSGAIWFLLKFGFKLFASSGDAGVLVSGGGAGNTSVYNVFVSDDGGGGKIPA